MKNVPSFRKVSDLSMFLWFHLTHFISFWQSIRTSLCVNMTMPRPSLPASICGRLCSLNICNGGFLFLFCCFLLQHLPLTQGQGNGNGNMKIEGECGNMLRCSLSLRGRRGRVIRLHACNYNSPRNAQCVC